MLAAEFCRHMPFLVSACAAAVARPSFEISFWREEYLIDFNQSIRRPFCDYLAEQLILKRVRLKKVG
jgi:hypothetical protein